MHELITQRKFPHLLPEEQDLWRKFITTHGKEYTSFSYDVRVGKGAHAGKDKDPKYQEMWKKLTQKRIDVVGYSKDGITIFEVRPNADLPILGKLLGYKTLYLKTFYTPEKINLAIVTNSVTIDDKTVFEAHKIKIFLV